MYAVPRFGVGRRPVALAGVAHPAQEVVPEPDSRPVGTIFLEHTGIDVDDAILLPGLVRHDQFLTGLVGAIHGETDALGGADELVVDEELLLSSHRQGTVRAGKRGGPEDARHPHHQRRRRIEKTATFHVSRPLVITLVIAPEAAAPDEPFQYHRDEEPDARDFCHPPNELLCSPLVGKTVHRYPEASGPRRNPSL